MNIYIGNLPYSVEESDISALFEQYGEVSSVKLITDRETGRRKGFGFVEMEDDAAQSAIDALNQYELDGRKLVVNEARERTERGNGGGGGGGRRNDFNRRRY